jgi:hypothetical protein
MRNSIALLALLATACFPPIANAGDKAGNGGDPCEARFKDIRDDIQSWIVAGGSAGLSLPPQVSHDRYRAEMLAGILAAQVSCTQDAVMVEDAEKVCKNQASTAGAGHITCNRRAFLELSENDQYVLVHHEYAGLAGFEESRGSESIYPLSEQLSAYLESTVVRRLAVKPAAPRVPLPDRITCTQRTEGMGPSADVIQLYPKTGLFQYFPGSISRWSNPAIDGRILSLSQVGSELEVRAEWLSRKQQTPVSRTVALTIDTSTFAQGFAAAAYKYDRGEGGHADCTLY